MSEGDSTRAHTEGLFPPGRTIRIHADDLAKWQSKPDLRVNRPICREPLTDDELPESVVARVAELLEINPYNYGRKRHTDVTNAQWQAIREFVFARSGGLCVYCGAKAEHIDHVIPISKFGSWHPDNCAAACVTCNCSKNATDVEVWRARK